ncbi:GatB/YqeY domain-containing protein [Gottschalkiaceae bacterium SANA]|nr:GatB/YqeY domain-containing protein [Gottschalkiaceae bacterium SANA]
MEDLKSAMRNKEKRRKDTITMLRAAVKQREVDERIELADEDVLAIVGKQVKQKRESIKEFQKAARIDLVEQAEEEIEILMVYLPEQLTEDEIDEIVREAIVQTGAASMRDMGRIMGVVMPKVKGKADGSLISQSAKKLLNQ